MEIKKGDKVALVIGATGLVGRALVGQLLQDEDYALVHVFVRRPMGIFHRKLEETIVDFADEASWTRLVVGDVLFSTLGTTRSQAGSTRAQRIVDYDYQFQFAKAAAANGVRTYILISSIGADHNSLLFYPKMKGELDRDVQTLCIPNVHILRPGPLMGPRETPRAGDKIGKSIIEAFNSLGLLKKYRPISDQQVAKAMRIVAKLPGNPACIQEALDLFSLVESA